MKMREFRVGDILSVDQTRSVVAKSDLIDGNIPYVTRTVSNNGYTRYCGNVDKINKGHCITIGAETGVAFYQPDDFVAGNKVYRLSMDVLTRNQYLYFVAVLNMLSKNYSYSDARIPEKIRNEIISLPVTDDGSIDFEYMERYISELEAERISELEAERISELEAYLAVTGLDDYELTDEDKRILSLSAKATFDQDGADGVAADDAVRFAKFRIGDLFEKLPVIKAQKSEVSKCKDNEFCVPVVYCKNGDNGIMYWGRRDEFSVYQNVISIVYNGVVAAGRVYAQEDETGILAESYFVRVKDIAVSHLVNLYLKTAIEFVIFPKYSRENLATWDGKVDNDIIVLPVDEDGHPDYDYMEKYIRAMEKQVIACVYEDRGKMIEATKSVVGV